MHATFSRVRSFYISRLESGVPECFGGGAGGSACRHATFSRVSSVPNKNAAEAAYTFGATIPLGLTHSARCKHHGPQEASHPRPTNGILVAINVINCTFASSGRFAI